MLVTGVAQLAVRLRRPWCRFDERLLTAFGFCSE
jgi:hypothetical protein